MAGNPLASLPEEEREARLGLIREQAAREGKVVEMGVRPPGAPFPQATPEAGYYGTPLLKEPQWGWEIPPYFFVGGVAGAAGIIATVADWLSDDQELARDARRVGVAGGAISASLLSVELGRPKRFLYMLRVFKPQSPMSVGSWILAAFGSTNTAAVFTNFLRRRFRDSLTIRALDNGTKALAGLLSLPLSNYTGVLIGATAIPVWHRNIKTLPIHFGASGVQAGVSILELLGHIENPSLNILGIGSAAWETWEGIHLERRNEAALRPLKRGTSGWVTRSGGALSGPLPLALRLLAMSVSDKRARKLRKCAAISGIAGSVLTRYGWIWAGAASARATAGTSGV